ncbi:MAG TPA: M23 family metallopeptidase [Thermoanaerobaculia bacterium]|jgi:murein DD-endopeptidase MepM/ murein hydrolase activator NlpD|nr:M23 family metallopeptidase [Thermoanaerobaculia bacterium]
MAKRHHTIILIPHAHAKLRKWQITSLQVGIAAGALFLLSFAAAFFIWSHFSTKVNPVEIARLKSENERLRKTNLTFESSLQRLQGQLSEYEDRTRQLAIVAGVESLESGADAGIGGGTSADEVEAGGLPADLTAIEDRAGQIAGVLDTVEAKLNERVRWISSTPAITPVKGIFTSGFGYRSDPLTHGRGVHQGVDIAAAPGQPVRASADGVVVRAGEIGGLGQAVFVAHGFGVTTRYGHMSRIEVRPGQRVKRGDVVGRVGNTGRSTGYHLHYEVRVDGDPVNPLAYILDAAASGAS